MNTTANAPFVASTALRSALFGLALMAAGLTLAGIDTLAAQGATDANALMAQTPATAISTRA
ncbi:MAG: hypothetical protein LCH73_14955 [Proteobacteria bacterium]|nr:hypothetical protein [Pseudomonadota bacterium]